MTENILTRYQNLLSAILISGTMLGSVFMVGRYVERLANQHTQMINTQAVQGRNLEKLLDLYIEDARLRKQK